MTDRRDPVPLAVAGVIIAAMAILVPFTVENTYATFWALVPPVVAIGLALITKEVFSSLFIGIVVGGMFACGGSVTAAIDNVVSTGLISAVEGSAGIFVFLVILGILGLFIPFLSLSNNFFCYVGIVLFLGYTAYDTQQIRNYYSYYCGYPDMLEKAAVFSALQLYLDFLNLFLYLLRFLGSRRSN